MKKPTTPTEMAACRASMNCEIGIKTIEGKTNPPANTTRQEYAIYCLLHAVKDMAEFFYKPTK